MKTFHIVAPVVMFGLFGFAYAQHRKTAALAETARAEAAAITASAETAAKAGSEQKAREDSARRAAERLALELKQAEEKRAQHEVENIKIREETAAFAKRAAELAFTHRSLEAQLVAAKALRKNLGDEIYALARVVEQNEIEKRTTELELQRLTEILVRKAAGTSLAAEQPRSP